MKKPIMTLFIVFSILALLFGGAFAGGEESHSFIGKIKSMMGESTVFHQPQRLSKLIGAEVRNDKGERLGKVDDLIADEDGRISYMVLSKGGMLSFGSKLVAIPMSAIEPRVTKDGKLNINLAKQTLDQAPTFTASKYPDFSNKNWQDNVRGYFESRETQPSPLKKVPEKAMPTPKEKAPESGSGSGN